MLFVCGMVVRVLRKIYVKIICWFNLRLKLVNLWCGEFIVDMLIEVFLSILKDILDWINFGYEFSEMNI